MSLFSKLWKSSKAAKKVLPTRTLQLEALEDRFLPTCNVISGYIYNDINNNGIYDKATESPLPFVNVDLRQMRNGVEVVVDQTTTDINGYYEFDEDLTIDTTTLLSLPEKTVTFNKTQTNFSLQGLLDQFDSDLGTLQSIQIVHTGSIESLIKVENTSTVSGSTISGKVSGTITLTGGGLNNALTLDQLAGTKAVSSFDGLIDFGGFSGYSFDPKSASGSSTITLTGAAMAPFISAGGGPVGQVTLTESAQASSTATGDGNLVLSIASSAQGAVKVIYRYLPNNCLQPGSYTIVETSQPPGLFDGQESRGNVPLNNAPGVDRIPVVLNGVDLTNNNFGELPPASISGFVYVDADNDGVKDTFPVAESGIPSVTLALRNDDTGQIVATTLTDAYGFYQFNNLRPGRYSVLETQPAAYLDGKDTLGSLNGLLGNDQLSNIPLVGNGTNYNFGELTPGSLSGHVYVDRNENGVMDSGDTPLSGVVVTLTGIDDVGVLNRPPITTDANGFYQFSNLRPGTYSIQETQPNNYNDGQESIGTLSGVKTNDQFSLIAVGMGGVGTDYDFGEILKENADLGIVKTVDHGSVVVGSNVTYTLTVTNYGTFTANQVVVTDVLPPESTYLSAFGPGWTITRIGNTLTATTASLPVGVSSSITITVKAPLVSTIINNSTSVTSITPDKNPANNQASVSVFVYNLPGQTFPSVIAPLVTLRPVGITGKAMLIAVGTGANAANNLALATYIDGLYRTLTGAKVPASALPGLIKKLSTGKLTKEQLVAQLWNTAAHRTLQANALYLTFYDRLPTKAERSLTVSKLRSGISEQQLASDMLISSEYQIKHPSSVGLVAGIYQDLQSAIPDLSSLLLTAQAMGATSWNSFVQTTMSSFDTLSNIVSASYRATLRREPTASEIQDGVIQLQNGVTAAQFQQGLLTSAEFYQLCWAVSKTK